MSVCCVCCNLQVVTLKFDKLDLEQHPSCAFDSVSIYNGVDEDSPPLGKYCTVAPSNIIISGQSVLVKFTSDGSVHEGRFSLNWTIKTPGGPQAQALHLTPTGEALCQCFSTGVTQNLKPCPHCRRQVRLSPLSRRYLRQSHFSATVWAGFKGSDSDIQERQ